MVHHLAPAVSVFGTVCYECMVLKISAWVLVERAYFETCVTCFGGLIEFWR